MKKILTRLENSTSLPSEYYINKFGNPISKYDMFRQYERKNQSWKSSVREMKSLVIARSNPKLS